MSSHLSSKVDLHRVIGRRHGRRDRSTTEARFALSCALDATRPSALPVPRDDTLAPEDIPSATPSLLGALPPSSFGAFEKSTKLQRRAVRFP